MKTTANQILDTLQYTSVQYEIEYLEWFDRWCWAQATNDYSIYVQTLQNGSVSKWFAIEFEKLEQRFLKISESMPRNTVQLRMHHKVAITEIFGISPKVLLEGIKPNQELNKHVNMN
jgi:hypothetical protein